MQVTSIFMLRILCNALLHGLRHTGLCKPPTVAPNDDTPLQAWMRRRVLQLLTLLRGGGLWLAMMTCAGWGTPFYTCAITHTCLRPGHTPAALHLEARTLPDKGSVQLPRTAVQDHIDAMCRLMAALGLLAVHHGLVPPVPIDAPTLGGEPQARVAVALQVWVAYDFSCSKDLHTCAYRRKLNRRQWTRTT